MNGTLNVGVKSTKIDGGHQQAKAVHHDITDTEVRKRGEQMGLETPVVHAVNHACRVSGACFPVLKLTLKHAA